MDQLMVSIISKLKRDNNNFIIIIFTHLWDYIFLYTWFVANDYVSGPYTATFPAGTNSASFVVSITNDNLLEGNEIFILSLDALLLPRGVTIGQPARATVTITDSGGK